MLFKNVKHLEMTECKCSCLHIGDHEFIEMSSINVSQKVANSTIKSVLLVKLVKWDPSTC